MSEGPDWVLTTDFGGRVRRFGADSMPVSIGGSAQDDITIAGVQGSVRIGVLDGVFFLDPARGTRNLRVGGEPVAATRRLADGDVVALDSARLACRVGGGRLTLVVDAIITAGDTAPPDLDELARGAGATDEVEIKPIAFRADAAPASAPRSRLPSPSTIIVSIGFAVLALLAWFAFTAKSVQLEFTPQPASVSLPGTLLKLHLSDRMLLRSGRHRVTAELPGYYPLDTVITVGPSSDQTLKLALTKLPGKITLEAEPDVTAQVALDGKPLGKTPLTADIVPGKHRLEFSADRYLAEVRELDVAGEGKRQTLSVKMTPNWAPVSLTTEPAGAEVLVDGQTRGTTPASLELTAGKHALEVRLHGYNAWQNSVEVVADQPQQLPPVKLTQADGRIELATMPGGAAATVDGEFKGRTPLTLRLRPGRDHELTVAKPGYETVSRTLSVAADSGRKLALDLVAEYGKLHVETQPKGAAVFVDGEEQAATPADLRLTALPHKIEIRAQGYATKSTQVTPRPGYAQTLRYELVALDQGSGSGYPPIVRTSLGEELKLIPAGEFTMGTPRGQQGRRSNEVQRRVKLSQAFYLGVREVTNKEFRAYEASHDSGSFHGLSLNGDDQPVVHVSWDDVAQFLNWLSIKDGLQPVYEQKDGQWVAVRPLRDGYRLPTEAEWAWAARFAKRDKPLVYPWGQELPPPDRSGNFADVSAAQVLPTTLVTYSDGFKVTAPVASFAPDALGLYDMGGNVSEWTQDFYSLSVEPGSGDKVSVDPLGPTDGRFHVVRGPSWRSATVTDLRMAYRDYADEGREDLGFRLARNLQ